jgi:hypothetical protein
MNKHENGQSLVIIAISFLALTAVAALIIDGGSLYLNRRNAQTAADAAALAGAREMCVNNGSDSAVQNVVNQYAVTENGATTANTANIDRAIYSVTVQTMLETSSFFARVLGYENNTVGAEASARCFPQAPSEDLLPVAWACRDKIDNKCSPLTIPYEVFKAIPTAYKNRLHQNGNLVLHQGNGIDPQTYYTGSGASIAYLVMDTNSFNISTFCKEIDSKNLMTCDFNGDGILDIGNSADVGWLYLDGESGTAKIKNVITGGLTDPITLPRWFPGKPGTSGGAFDAIIVDDQPSLLPVVLNTPCQNINFNQYTNCFSYIPGDQITPDNKGKSDYYRVTGFQPFVVTCVSKVKNDVCPFKNISGVDEKTNTIEGYFVSGYIEGSDIDPGGTNNGTYVISLMK